MLNASPEWPQALKPQLLNLQLGEELFFSSPHKAREPLGVVRIWEFRASGFGGFEFHG